MVHYELNLRDYLRIVKKRKFVIISSVVIFIAGAFIYTKSEIPIYEATAKIKVEERKTVAGLLTEWIIYNPADIMESQTKIIKGFPVLKRAAEKLKLITERDSREAISAVIINLQKVVEAEKEGNSNIIKISVSSENAKEAMNTANAVVQAFIEDNLSEKNKQARTARQFIEGQLANVEKKLHAAEEKIKSYGATPEGLRIDDEQQKKLADLDFQLNSLLQKYTDKHPKIIQLKEQISELERRLDETSGDSIDISRARREVEVNKKLYSMLREKLEEVKITEAEKVPDVSIVDPALLPHEPTNRRSPLTIFLGGFLGAIIGVVFSFVAETLDTSIGTIEDVENVIKLPVLGIIPSITCEGKEKERNRFSWFKQRVFPAKESEKDRAAICLISHYKPSSPVTEAFRNLKANIKLSPSRKVVLITSAGPQEGKTTIISNLGIVCAQDGLKTILVSADLRRPSLGVGFGIEMKPGLSDAVMGSVNLSDCLRNISNVMIGQMNIDEVLKSPGLGYLSILPAGTIPLNPTEILGSKEADIIIGKLKEMFDIILFDTPPVLPVADASILAGKVDAVMLCYEIGKTSRQALLHAKNQLEAIQANIIGVILNHTKAETQIADVYPYYYKYKYYGQEKKDKGKPVIQ